MKQYLKNRKLSDIICDQCGITCQKPISEIKRSINLHRKMFCSRTCSAKAANFKNQNEIKQRFSKYRQIGSKCDKYSCFRPYLRSCKKRYQFCDIDLEYLANLWEFQKGLCPYTHLPIYLKIHNSNKKNNINLYQASLDRIDSSKGYIKGNIEFVALGINYMKSTFSKNDVLNFLQNFKNSNFLEDRTISSLY